MSDLKLERKIVWLAMLIQLANVLDFMIILPLGPDLTRAINIPSSDMGLVGGIYTFAAAFSGILFAPYLDHFDRKKAILIFMVGLVISTFMCAFAYDRDSMLVTRTLAGLFGGPVTALTLAMVVDMVPVARRGRAIALVTSAFTVSSVFGIPLGLELSRLVNWQLPFYVIAGFGLLVAIGIFLLLPPMTDHMEDNKSKRKKIPIISMLKRKDVLISYSLMSLMSFAQFMLFAGSIIYFVFNLDYPREDLGSLYAIGGGVSFIAMMMTGQIVDRFGARLLSFVVTFVYVLVLADGYLHTPFMSVPFIFCAFMTCAAIMGVICSSITSEVPGEKERAAYMSLQSTMRHLAAGAGGVISSVILVTNMDGSLSNINQLAYVTIICIILLPTLVVILRRLLSLKALKSKY